MDIKDTVLDLLSPEEDGNSLDDLSLFDSLTHRSLNKVDALDLTNRVIEIIDNGADSNELLYNFSLMQIAKIDNYYYAHKELSEGMALVIDYHLNPNQDALIKIKEITLAVRGQLEKTAAREELNNKFATAELSMNYLEDFFGDDLIDEVVEITGVSKATVKRYRSGSNPKRSAHDLLTNLAKMFYLFSEIKTNDEILNFYKNEIVINTSVLGGVSVRDYITQYHRFSHLITNYLRDNYGWSDIY